MLRDQESSPVAHPGLARPRRVDEDRVGPDRPRVPIITAGKKEPTTEIHPAPNPRPDGSTGPAPDQSDLGRPEAPEPTSPPPALPSNAPVPQRNTTRTGRTWTERKAGDSADPGRSPESVLSAGGEQPHTGPRTSPSGVRSPTHRVDGDRKRRREGETRRPFERKMATRKWLATDSGRVARAKDLCFVAKFLGIAKERGSTETSEDLSGPNS